MPSTAARRRARYESDVRALAGVAEQLRSAGWSEQRIARHLVAARNRLKMIARKLDDPAVIVRIEARNRAKYGHPLGPTAKQLHRRYGSWRAVSDAAARPGVVELRGGES